jgi:hypothetical protein
LSIPMSISVTHQGILPKANTGHWTELKRTGV